MNLSKSDKLYIMQNLNKTDNELAEDIGEKLSKALKEYIANLREVSKSVVMSNALNPKATVLVPPTQEQEKRETSTLPPPSKDVVFYDPSPKR